MEKLITIRNLSLFGIVSFLLVIALYFILQNNSKDDEKLFDIFLAELYNEQNSNLDEKLYYLSSLDNPKVSFFSDLKLTSIEKESLSSISSISEWNLILSLIHI